MPFPRTLVFSDNPEALLPAIRLALLARGESALFCGWAPRDGGIILFRHDPPKGRDFQGYARFPAALDAEGVAPIVLAFLKAASGSYPKEPDHDGTNVRGWQLDSRVASHPNGPDAWEAVCSVAPAWMEYGK